MRDVTTIGLATAKSINRLATLTACPRWYACSCGWQHQCHL